MARGRREVEGPRGVLSCFEMGTLGKDGRLTRDLRIPTLLWDCFFTLLAFECMIPSSSFSSYSELYSSASHGLLRIVLYSISRHR